MSNHSPSKQRWIVKFGSALLTNDGCGLKHELITVWVKQIVALNARGIDVVIVSSGAVAEGISRLGWHKRPTLIHDLQAAAAVGQTGLIQAYETCFQQYGKLTAQVLLTHDDIANRARYLNARTSLQSLIKLGVIAIINENDTVATDEIRFGDNDTLAGLVANLVDADLLVLLTDQTGLYTADPRLDPEAKLIRTAAADDRLLEDYAGGGSKLGRGGMRTKLKAARIAARSGTQTIIASGHEADVLLNIADGEHSGTMLTCGNDVIQARKRWLANQSHLKGSVVLDDGAVNALLYKGKSLLPVGVQAVHGIFKRGEIIACLNSDQQEIARGLSNYDSAQISQIMGQSTRAIRALLGTLDADELIHRDNLMISD